MKNIAILPLVYLSTALYVSYTIVIKPLRKRLNNGTRENLKKLYKSFYLSRR